MPRSVTARVVLWTLVAVAVGVVGAALWQWWAQPAVYQVTERGAILDEQAIRGQFQVVAVFVAVGAGLGLVWGSVVAALLNELGWRLVPWFVVSMVAAGLVAWRLGEWWGPTEPTAASVRGLSVGDTVPSALSVDAWTAFLAWPLGALLGLFVVTYVIGLRSAARPPA